MNLRSRPIAICLAAAVVACASLAGAASALGSFHLMKIREVHNGTGVGDDYDFVELQMYASGQRQVSAHYIRTYDSTGDEFGLFQFPSSVPSGQNQRTILISAGPTANGVTPDFPSAPLSVPSQGAACFLDTLGAFPDIGNADVGIDCVSFGFFNPINQPWTDGEPSPVGNVAAEITPGLSLHRSISRGCRLKLDAADDSNDSASDFALGAPNPRSNATKPTEIRCVPCPTRKRLATIVGTGRRDVINGTRKADRIAGLGGNDLIRGRGGNDVLCGGNGRDVLLGQAGFDRLLGQNGNDLLRGGARRDFLLGGNGFDRLFGQAGPDVLIGGPRRDRLFGGPARDRCRDRRDIRRSC